MLVLTRKVNESVVINGNIVVTVLEIDRGKIKLGVQAPKNVKVDREEVHLAKQSADNGKQPTRTTAT